MSPTALGGLVQGIQQGVGIASTIDRNIQNSRNTKAYQQQVGQQEIRLKMAQVQQDLGIITDPLQPDTFRHEAYNRQAKLYGLPELPDDVPIPNAGMPILKRMKDLVASNKPTEEKLRLFSGFHADYLNAMGNDVAAKPYVDALVGQQRAEDMALVNVAMKYIDDPSGQGVSDEDAKTWFRLRNDKSPQGLNRLRRIEALANQVEAERIAQRDKGLSTGVRDQLAAQRDPSVARAVEADIQSGLIGKTQGGGERELPAGLIEPVADGNTSLRAIAKIEEMFGVDTKDAEGNIIPAEGKNFIGMLDSQLGRARSKTGRITPKEANFRTRVNLMKTELRKFYFGTAQSKQELAGSLEAIPALDMSDTQFVESLKVHKERVQTWLEEIRNGLRVPGKVQEKDELDLSNVSDEEFMKKFLGQ